MTIKLAEEKIMAEEATTEVAKKKVAADMAK